jgi:1-acyl-sn-glycerol-3-phosphate acyltransferase
MFTFLFKLFGWKLIMDCPKDLKKGLFVVCPHASWTDFLVGLGTRAATGFEIGYLGKEELFKPPFGWIFHALGGKPVVRSHSTNLVQSVAETFNKYDDIKVAMAPEGTRKNTDKLKTGFYYMAHTANVPLVLVGFDYPRKTVFISEPKNLSGDFKKDMQEILLPFYKNIQGVQKDWMKNYENDIF